MSIQEKINGMLKENRVMLFMKGSPYQPQCGFSARTVKALMECDVVFSYVDILDNPEIRQTLPDISDWPTFPQLFVDGELIGGCDIITEMHSNGELKEVLTEAIN
jgi:monothiol glutaredoxin|tara:strand:+ start:269 stop:583 length:315 start_codon:yes stop_codon:yes gene_type:complete